MEKRKYYVVWVGRKPGIYQSWGECQKQTHQFDGAKFKAYGTKAEAEAAYKSGWKKSWGQSRSAEDGAAAGSAKASGQQIDYDSISVDVGTRGNPGPVEYKGVDTQTGEVLFSHGPISKGTNNLGEFLAIVHGLAYLQKLGSDKTVYSDSVNAIKWVKMKKVATTLARDESTAEIWRLIDRAVHWLETNAYKNKVAKWQTQEWGEIKADYGRK